MISRASAVNDPGYGKGAVAVESRLLLGVFN